MKVPPWDCYTPSDKRAFADFIIDRLGELAEAEHGSPEYDDDVKHYIAMLRLEQAHEEARKAGISVPEPKKRRGAQRRDRNHEELLLESAIRGVKKMKPIFEKYCNKSNRMVEPYREDIAAEIWNLNKRQKSILKSYFNKK
jgi:hypothetical protein